MNGYLKKLTESIEQAKEEISKIREENSLVFPIFTDLHTMDESHIYTQKLLSALKLITEEIRYDAVINLGDTFYMLGRSQHIKNNDLKDRFEKVFTAIFETTGHPLINVNGNHDGIGTDFFKADFWNGIVKHKFGNDLAVYGDDGSYYYIDFEKADTRLVVLSLPYDSDIESEMPKPLWRFGENQLKWMESTALNTDKNILILSHVPFGYKYTGDMEAQISVWNGEREAMSRIFDLCGEIGDIDEAVRIISKASRKVIGCLSGHTHFDLLLKPFEERDGMKNPLPCHQLITTSACIGEMRKMGISIDIAVFSPSKKRIDVFRIGDGEREISF